MVAVLGIGSMSAGLPFAGSYPPERGSHATKEQIPRMQDQSSRTVALSSLKEGMPGLTPTWGGVLAEAASVCLEEQNHEICVELVVDGIFEELLVLERLTVDEQMRDSHYDEQEATEHGACGIAILGICCLTNLRVLKRSWKGSGCDYWIGPDKDPWFEGAVRLEISGIRKGDESTIRTRVQRKVQQTQLWGGTNLSPAFVGVVEFSRPLLRIAKQ
jgi:hypothetical protein